MSHLIARPAVFPLPRASIAAGGSFTFSLMPQRKMRLTGIRIGPERAKALTLRRLQVGMDNVLHSHGEIDGVVLEGLEFDAPTACPGTLIEFEIWNRSNDAIDFAPTVLALVVHETNSRGSSLRWYRQPGRLDPSDLLDAAEAEHEYEPSERFPDLPPEHDIPLTPQRRAICMGPGSGPGSVSTPPELQPQPAPEPALCRHPRPDSGERCRYPEGHSGDHWDGLAQTWPQQATPTRHELQERELYLQDPDDWSAWQSATDES